MIFVCGVCVCVCVVCVCGVCVCVCVVCVCVCVCVFCVCFEGFLCVFCFWGFVVFILMLEDCFILQMHIFQLSFWFFFYNQNKATQSNV